MCLTGRLWNSILLWCDFKWSEGFRKTIPRNLCGRCNGGSVDYSNHITSSAETTSTATKKEFNIIKNKSSFLFCLLDLLLAAAWGRVKRDTNNLEPYNRYYIGWRAVNTCGGGGNNARDRQRNELRPQRPRIKTQHPVRGPLGGCCAWRTDWLRRYKTLRENKVKEDKKIKLLL